MTKRYSSKTGETTDSPKVEMFLNEIIEVCQKHNMCISHQDDQGFFLIEEYNTKIIEWLKEALDMR